jgi:hypothetical protein
MSETESDGQALSGFLFSFLEKLEPFIPIPVANGDA